MHIGCNVNLAHSARKLNKIDTRHPAFPLKADHSYALFTFSAARFINITCVTYAQICIKIVICVYLGGNWAAYTFIIHKAGFIHIFRNFAAWA